MNQEHLARFEAKVERIPFASCWYWIGATAKGYGQMKVGSRVFYSHRLAHEHWVGPIEDGEQIDHLCRTPLCVNPEHLEAVSPRLNTLRSRAPAAENSRRTHCVHGHELAGDNLYLRKRKRGGRTCRECKNAHARRARES